MAAAILVYDAAPFTPFELALVARAGRAPRQSRPICDR
jgi:hypothetical protein